MSKKKLIKYIIKYFVIGVMIGGFIGGNLLLILNTIISKQTMSSENHVIKSAPAAASPSSFLILLMLWDLLFLILIIFIGIKMKSERLEEKLVLSWE